MYSSLPPAMTRPLPTRAVLGLSNVDVDGKAWRMFVAATPLRVVQVRQPLAARRRPATAAAWRSVLPIGVAAPLVALAIWRDKSSRDLSVSLGKAQPEKAEAVVQAEGGSLGLTVRPLDREEQRGAGVDHGLLIERVSGPAQLAGVQPGDVLLALNGRPVQRVGQVREALRQHPKHVALLVSRDGQQIFVPGNLG